MSHNYPYRRPTSDTDLRPADRRHISPDQDFYRPSQESFSSSYPSSSSSRGSASAQWAQDGALSILSSCGLEPSDLALLAELPEDVLTVESLPHVLKEIKGKRGIAGSFPPSTLTPSSSSASYRQPPVRSSRDWDRPRRQPIQYPLTHVAPGSVPSEQDRWRNPSTSSSFRSDPTPPLASSSSRYSSDFRHRPGPSAYGKTGRSADPVPSFNSAALGKRSHSTEARSADKRTAPLPEVHHPKSRGSRRESQTSSSRSSGRHAGASSMPSEKEALDFHGTCPTVFPYSCSLCDITVLSEKVWIKHINGTQHAEGQLSLLQRFPDWDCRLESVSRAKKQVEKGKDEEKTSRPSQTSSQNNKPAPEKKTSEKSKVVCVKFPPQSVDEAYLRKLTEPFGKIIKILMFPSLAFLELGSSDQAKDLVKFHVNYPPTVNGEQMEFSISNTFNFLQSSQVVSFTPAPPGEDGQSDLISIVRRFGTPLYSLFLPSVACVEMKNAPDAQKLVDYYSSNTLRINNYCIKVSFSGEYKTLMRVPSAKRYEEENATTKRTRSRSQEKDDDKTESKRRRSSSSSKDRDQERRKSSQERRTRTRSRSRDKGTSSLSTSRDKSKEKVSEDRKTRSRSRDKSSRGTRTRSKSREKSTKETKSRSRSSDKSSNSSSRQDGSKEKEEPEPVSRTEDDPAPLGQTAETQQTEDAAALSSEDSDIEGMEVIGEDGKNVEEEDVEIQNTAEEEEEEEEEAAEEREHQAERTDSRETDKETKVKDENEEEEVGCEMKKPEEESERSRETEEAAETQLEDEEEEPDFPVDLENCITLDELEEDQSDSQGEDVLREAEASSTSSRVVSFRDLPSSSFTDAQFIQLVQGSGKAVRYFLIRQDRQGFIEMSSPSEAQRAAEELSRKCVSLNGSKLTVDISHTHHRLNSGWDVQSDKKQSESQSSGNGSERQSESKTSVTEDTCRESERKEGEEEPGPNESEEKTTEKEEENNPQNTIEKESEVRKSPEQPSEETLRTTADKDSSHNLEGKEPEDSAAEETLGRKAPVSKSEGKKTQTEKQKEGLTAESPETQCEVQRVCSEEASQSALKSPDQQETEQEDQLHRSEEPAPEPEPEEPTKPVGTEFVRPVVGYFCHLCQLIYADEDEAKLQHCSSLTHYRKYQEKTGKDPWTS